MSFILDALKKSHRERESNQLPDLDYWVPPKQDQHETNWVLVVLGLILILNLLAVGFWIGYTIFIKEKAGRQVTIKHAAGHNINDHEYSQVEIPETQEQPQAPFSRPLIESTNQNDPLSLAQPKAQWSLQVEANADEMNNKANKEKFIDKESSELSREQDDAALKFEEQGFEVIKPGDFDELLLSQDVGEEEVIAMSDLPYHVQNVLPAINFVSHVFTEESNRRSIIIDQGRFREGDRISESLLLERIEKNAVVLQYEDFRFRLLVQM